MLQYPSQEIFNRERPLWLSLYLEERGVRGCNSCFSKEKIKTTTTFTVDYKGCIIVIKNVSCYECQVCGEIIFSDETSAHIEYLVSETQKILQDVTVIDYNKVA